MVGPQGADGPAPCVATSSRSQGTYNVTFQLPASSSPADENMLAGGRRRLMARGGAKSSGAKADNPNNQVTVSADMWGGYRIHEDLSNLNQVYLDGAGERERWLGGSSGSNRVVGGLMIHQMRGGLDPSSCGTLFSNLSTGCSEVSMYKRYASPLETAAV